MRSARLRLWRWVQVQTAFPTCGPCVRRMDGAVLELHTLLFVVLVVLLPWYSVRWAITGFAILVFCLLLFFFFFRCCCRPVRPFGNSHLLWFPSCPK